LFNGLAHAESVTLNLAANRGDEEVSAAGIEALVNKEIDLAEIDDAHIEGDFLGV